MRRSLALTVATIVLVVAIAIGIAIEGKSSQTSYGPSGHQFTANFVAPPSHAEISVSGNAPT
jgi:hypothetical protein